MDEDNDLENYNRDEADDYRNEDDDFPYDENDDPFYEARNAYYDPTDEHDYDDEFTSADFD